MKKIFLAILLFGATYLPAKACDVCGYGVSNYNPFLLPHLSKSYMSLSYLHRLYHTHSDAGIHGKEYYNSLLVTGEFGLTNKIKLIATLPYQFNKRKNSDVAKNISGVGDMSLLL